MGIYYLNDMKLQKVVKRNLGIYCIHSWKSTLIGFALVCIFGGCVVADNKPPSFDYCKQLEQEIQGRKHGFLAGNLAYYIGGFHGSWNLQENETISLTHPFHHDLHIEESAYSKAILPVRNTSVK